MKRTLSSLLTLLACVTSIGCEESGPGGDPTNTEELDGCAKYLDESSAGEVRFEIKNERPVPIYISDGQCETRLEILADGEVRRAELLRDYEWACERVQTSTEAPRLDCFDFVGSKVAPGETFTLTWSGLFYEARTTMPESCAADPDHSRAGNCFQGEAAADESMEVRVKLYADGSCGSGFCSLDQPFSLTQSFALGRGGPVQILVAE